VELQALNTGPDPYHFQIGGHMPVVAIARDGEGAEIERITVEEAAWAGTEGPREVELCVHELDWLEHAVPGKDHKLNLKFKWERVKGREGST
jgi:hypothetical protein